MTNQIKVKKNKQKEELTMNVDMIMAKEGKYFVCYIPSLNLTSYSPDEKEAKSGIKDAVDIFINAWFESGRLFEKLRDLGWKKSDHTMIPVNSQMIPLFLLKKEKNEVRTSKYPIKLPLLTERKFQPAFK